MNTIPSPEAPAPKTNVLTLTLGLFLATGIVAIAALTAGLGEGARLGEDRYRLRAQFVSASGLRPGASVELAGVRIGQVGQISLDPDTTRAEVELHIDTAVAIHDDAIASIRTSGIIGDKFVKISPGGSDIVLGPGAEILDTEPSINLEELISKYIFEQQR